MDKFKEFIETFSPLLLSSSSTSLTIGISKRFFLFRLLESIVKYIEEDPHLNFIALLKSYQILGRFLYGTLHEFYRDRNKLYFKNFFLDRKLYQLVKEDLEYLYPKYKEVTVTITKRGVVIYNNYRKDAFNVLLMTIHSGTWVPESIENKLSINEKDRFKEEDVYTHRLYCHLVLDKAGIWIDNKQSRFVVDFNRNLKNAIYANNSEEWLNIVWKEKLTKWEQDQNIASYREFYFSLDKLLETHQFNIIFDAHSMKDLKGRPNISFGTRYIPQFYIPIVRSMQRKMITMGYSPVMLNTPYHGGNILKWLSAKYPNIFIFSMEVNKKLYMAKNRLRIWPKKLKKVSTDLIKIFDIEDESDK